MWIVLSCCLVWYFIQNQAEPAIRPSEQAPDMQQDQHAVTSYLHVEHMKLSADISTLMMEQVTSQKQLFAACSPMCVFIPAVYYLDFVPAQLVWSPHNSVVHVQ